MQNRLKIEVVDIDSIKPNENNFKLHPQEQIEQIKLSIQRNKFNDPIAVRNNVILEGHGRYEALKQLGYKEIEIIRLDDLDEQQALEYMAAHNQLTINSGYDEEKLNLVFEGIDFDMAEYGFEIEDIDMDKLNTDFELPSGDKGSLTAISFSFSQEQADYINEKIKEFKNTKEFKNFKYEQNNNSNGNAIYLMVSEWEKLKT